MIFSNVLAVSCVIASVLVLQSFAASPKECEAQLIKTDGCIKKALLIGDHSVVMPQNIGDMDVHCKQGRDYLQCIRSYGKCLKLFPRQIFGILLGNIRKLFKETCDTPAGRRQFLKHSKCMRPEYLKEVHKLVDRFTIHLDHVAYNVSKDEKIPWLCCSYFVNQEVLKSTVSELCPGDAGQETLDYIVSLFNKVVSEAIDLGCGKYSSVSNCATQLPRAMNTFKELVTPASKVVPQKHSFLVPLITITKDLDEQ